MCVCVCVCVCVSLCVYNIYTNACVYNIYIYMCVCVFAWKSLCVLYIVEGNPKAPFSIATTPRCTGGRYSFPGLLYFTLDPYLIMLSVKQGGIKYHFLSLWYDSTWD